jgi:hypothetical protein
VRQPIWQRCFTDNPYIVIARPPRRIRKPKPGPKITGVIVGPLEPSAKPAQIIVGRKVTPEPPAERDHVPAEAAERLWHELVRRASRK